MPRLIRWAAPALLLATAAFADADPAFARLRDAALTPGQGGAVEGLGTFLDRYVGDCAGALDALRECAQNARAFRAKTTGKKFYLIVGEDSVSQLSAGPVDPRGTLTLNITPFFGANGYALTQGAPRKTDSNGNPLLPYLSVRREAPEGWNPGTLDRLIRMRGLRLQLVFTPQDVWSLPKKGGGRIYGIRARIHGLLVEEARTGNLVALWLDR